LSDIKDQYAKIKKELRPYYEKLIREVHKRGLYITGFIYGDMDMNTAPMLIRFGNIYAPTPEDMFSIHRALAVMAAQMEITGQMEREITSMEPSDESTGNSGPKPQSSEEIADRIVLALLSAPVDLLPGNIDELLKQYADSRKPEIK
jgi:hypothetical protein